MLKSVSGKRLTSLVCGSEILSCTSVAGRTGSLEATSTSAGSSLVAAVSRARLARWVKL